MIDARPEDWEDVDEETPQNKGEGEGERQDKDEDEDEDEDQDQDHDEDEDEVEADDVIQGEVEVEVQAEDEVNDLNTTPAPPLDMAKESAVYERIRAGKSPEEIKRWHQQLRSFALETDLLIHQKAASQSTCVKEADAAQKELQSYVRIWSLIIINSNVLFQSLRMYVKYGLSINGFILGANAQHLKVNATPRFFGPTPEFTSFLEGLLWTPPQIKQHIISYVL